MQERLQKILARHGLASRRKSEELILSGQIKVNGKLAKLGDKADETRDEITINNQKISDNKNFVYYLLNKPRGYICSFKRRKGEKLAVDLVPRNPRVWTVGRLDKDSNGLLILTNDGRLTEELTHPKFEHEKEYEVIVDGILKPDFLKKMKKGIFLEEGLASADRIRQLSKNKFSLTLHQGWKRQIRRMCNILGHEVVELKRVRIGKWILGNLKEGEWKKILINPKS